MSLPLSLPPCSHQRPPVGATRSKLRGSLRDASFTEAQITALQIAAARRVGKGTKVLLLDRNGGAAAKAVARELSRLGYGRTFVIAGGFNGWAQSKLLVKPAAAAGLAPLPAIARTTSTRPASPAPKALPRTASSRSQQQASGATATLSSRTATASSRQQQAAAGNATASSRTVARTASSRKQLPAPKQ